LQRRQPQRRVPTKKAAARKAAPATTLRDTGSWRVLCSKEGIIARGLSREAAKKQSEEHESATGHLTTFVGGQ